jgi:hypothetical protein
MCISRVDSIRSPGRWFGVFRLVWWRSGLFCVRKCERCGSCHRNRDRPDIGPIINLKRFVRKSGSNDVPHDPVQPEPCSIWPDWSFTVENRLRTGRVVNKLGTTSSEWNGETHERSINTAKKSSCVDAGRRSNDRRVLIGGRVVSYMYCCGSS